MSIIPMVSVSMVTYNHQKYLRQAIEGVLMQRTTFPVQLVIGEDCSTDGTLDICIEYKNKYPEQIKLVSHTQNVGSKQNAIDTINACEGKYIAICDGDDYWIDKNKLQRQISFLETHPEFSICCHRAQVLNEKNRTIKTPKALKQDIFYQSDVANHNFIQTLTVVFRREAIPVFPECFYNSISSDYFINLLASQEGKIKYFSHIMAVYRLHQGGIWTSESQIKGYENTLMVLESFMKEKIDDEVRAKLKRNIVRQHIKIYELFKRNGKEAESKAILEKVLSADFVDAWNQELELAILGTEKKERKIGKICLKPYIAFRTFCSKLSFFIHRLKYE